MVIGPLTHTNNAEGVLLGVTDGEFAQPVSGDNSDILTRGRHSVSRRKVAVQPRRSRAEIRNSGLTWGQALRSFLISMEGTNLSDKTITFYRGELTQLIRWAEAEGISFDEFNKPELDWYLSERRKTVSRGTLRHDAVSAKAFFGWCTDSGIIDESPFAAYHVKAAPRPFKYVPTEEEVRGILKALDRYWDPEHNPGMKNLAWSRRALHRERNRAIILMLLDTATRIGEVGNLKLDDYRAKEMQITIRESKGKEPRALPISPGTVEAVGNWLKVRERMMKRVPTEEDEGWLFLSEYGSAVDLCRFGKSIKAVLRWAGINDKITLHCLRHYSLNRLAKVNRTVAQQIAGHKDPRTTEVYIHLDADYMRQVHAQVGIVDTVLENRRLARKKRLA